MLRSAANLGDEEFYQLTLRSFCPQLSHPCNLSATLQRLRSPASPSEPPPWHDFCNVN